MRASGRGMVVVAALLACRAPASVQHEPAAQGVAGVEQMPAQLQAIVDDWTARVRPIVLGAMKTGRAKPQGETRWTDDERAQLERLRDEAQTVIAAADADARPWLLIHYAKLFYLFGLGREHAEALLELPPEHPAWADLHSLLDIAWEAGDVAAVELYAHALAEHHDNPTLEAESLFLHMRDADRARDWARAREYADRLAALRVGPPDDPQPIWGHVNAPLEDLHPDRMLRTETRVPHFCAQTLRGPELERVCLDELFPHAAPTLIIGSSSWCGPCREVVPQAIAVARARGWRGILINYDDSAEQAGAYRAEYAIEDWTTLIPRLDDRKPEGPGDLALRSIPYMALVDGEGQVTLGPPWLDGEWLAAQ